jgi:hypothetical protein
MPRPQRHCTDQRPGSFIGTGQCVSRRHRLGQLLDHQIEVTWVPENPLQVRESACDPPGTVRHLVFGHAAGNDVREAWRSDDHDPHETQGSPAMKPAHMPRCARGSRRYLRRPCVAAITVELAGSTRPSPTHGRSGPVPLITRSARLGQSLSAAAAGQPIASRTASGSR